MIAVNAIDLLMEFSCLNLTHGNRNRRILLDHSTIYMKPCLLYPLIFIRHETRSVGSFTVVAAQGTQNFASEVASDILESLNTSSKDSLGLSISTVRDIFWVLDMLH